MCARVDQWNLSAFLAFIAWVLVVPAAFLGGRQEGDIGRHPAGCALRRVRSRRDWSRGASPARHDRKRRRGANTIPTKGLPGRYMAVEIQSLLPLCCRLERSHAARTVNSRRSETPMGSRRLVADPGDPTRSVNGGLVREISGIAARPPKPWRVGDFSVRMAGNPVRDRSARLRTRSIES